MGQTVQQRQLKVLEACDRATKEHQEKVIRCKECDNRLTYIGDKLACLVCRALR
jgi:hypothetical protein